MYQEKMSRRDTAGRFGGRCILNVLLQARSDESSPPDLQLWKHMSVMFERSDSMTRRYFLENNLPIESC